jgi:Asp-tRNA(Asn)/Glu-tRNA(Gln) amidotransferase A subunit family amidase
MIKANYLTATETAELVRAGVLTVEQVAQDHLDRYHQRNDHVKAWAFIDPYATLEEARRLDRLPKNQRGVLFGVVLGVKDIMCMSVSLYPCLEAKANRYARCVICPLCEGKARS